MSGHILSRILWGANFDNQVIVEVPLLDPVFDRVWREGSEWIQGTSGIEDAWKVGSDFTLTCRPAYLPDRFDVNTYTPVSGSRSWTDFLDWARDKNAFRFVPDATFPDFYIPTCYLVEPLRGGWRRNPSVPQTLDQQLTIRNATYDFGLALRGLFLEYQAGGLTDQWTFARADTASFHDTDGVVQSAATGVLRGRHIIGSTHTTLLEAGSTNKALQSEDFSTTWNATNCSVATNDTTGPDDNATADKLTDDATSAVHEVGQTVTLAADATYALSVYVKDDDVGFVRLTVDEAAATANKFEAWFDLSDGSVGTSQGGGTGSMLRTTSVQVGEGFYRLGIVGSVGNAATAIRVLIRLQTADAQTTYSGTSESLWVWGAQCEDAIEAPTGYIATTTTTVARVADALTHAWPWKVQPAWAYVKFIERGAVFDSGFPDLVMFGATGAAGVLRWGIESWTGDKYRAVSQSDGTAAVSSEPSGSVVLGDTVELLAVLFGDGSVQLHQSINAAADTSGAQSGTMATGFPYSTANMGISNEGAGTAHVSAIGVEVFKPGPGTAINTIALARAK